MNEQDTQTVERVKAAIAEALGDAYDCTRVWEAWSVGTMTENDFFLVSDDGDRLDDLARAAIAAMQPDDAAQIRQCKRMIEAGANPQDMRDLGFAQEHIDAAIAELEAEQ
ncbi:hypothetical protein phiGT1_60 [Sulfitobacter phage phiGT1]|nr:hypothetical protein phiGT1_60 [Sulfitobacter phage phiGT1]